MNNRMKVGLAWTLTGISVLCAVFSFAQSLSNPSAQNNAPDSLFWQAVVPLAFSIVAALILVRQPHNTNGWLLMTIGVSLAAGGPLQIYMAQQASTAHPDVTTYLFLFLSGTGWWFLIGPLLLIFLVFPTGRLLSPRWRWVAAMVVLLFVTFHILAIASPTWEDPNTGMHVPNPLIVARPGFSWETIMVPWTIVLFTTAALCVAAIFVRYRRSNAVERQQLKWFFFASAIFIVSYSNGFLDESSTISGLLNGLFALAILFIPISIGIAILRYHLFDIDIIIRRTLVYSILTGLLVLFYFGSVVLLQQVLRGITGQASNVAIVISTLSMAALFSPLRHRVQRIIDLRFYRQKYDAQHVLAQFAATARDEVELSKLADRLLAVAEETMQPASASMWLKDRNKRGRRA